MTLDSLPLRSVPGAAVKISLQGLRLPISGLEALTGQRENETWPPAVVFESFEAGAKQVFGSILHDSDLVDEGRVQQAKVAELRQAVELEVKAEQTRAQADRDLRRKRDEAAADRRRAEEKARQDDRRIERERTAAKREAEQEVEEEADALDRSVQEREEQLTATERRSRLTQVNKEAAALEKRSKAVKATKAARASADVLDEKKKQRKAN